jgi:poly-gamma-glutamate capsule biosynthesis protein CapA/YwtB (metallophosphatase superfamily)
LSIPREVAMLRRSRTRRFAVLAAVAALGLSAIQLGQRLEAQQSRPQPHVYPDPGAMTMALTGDSIIVQALSPHREPEFLKLIELVRGADVAFTNLEMLFHDYEPFPSTQSGGTYMRAEPSLVKELVWAGFDLVAQANNHTGDYGVLGAQLTDKYVREAGLVAAGFGNSLREAREARFVETAKGRVALVSVSSTFPDSSRAGDSWGDTKARPGLAPLRFRTTQVVTRPQFDALQTAFKAANVSIGGGGGEGGGGAAATSGSEMTVLGRRFVVGDRNEIRTEPLKEDLEAMAAVVSNANRQADYVIVSSHTHENAGSRYVAPEFFVTFARKMVDAGADAIVVSGPHVLRGIEIYKNRPIFYSLGDFIFQNETLLRQPPENYEPFSMPLNSGVADFNDERTKNGTVGFPSDPYIFESVVAMPVFVGDRMTQLTLHPISLGFGQPRSRRGRPVLADPTLSKKIIEDLQKFSAAYRTTIELKDGVGVVLLAGS